MMSYPIIDALAGAWLMADGQIYDFDSAITDQLRKPSNHQMFYEVIRIADNTPLFWDDHMDRLDSSVGNNFKLEVDWLTECRQLLVKHLNSGFKLDGLNLRIVATPEIRVIHLIPSYYPNPEQFSHGVPVLIIDWERENPNVKIIKPDYKAAVAEGFARPGQFGSPFELLLADSQGYLTEGSRSNLFFIRGQDVLTAPDNSILLGITRKYVMQAIESSGAVLKTEMIKFNDLKSGNIDAAYLSGSPIDLLPISSIEDCKLESASNELFGRINYEYQNILAKWLSKHRNYRS